MIYNVGQGGGASAGNMIIRVTLSASKVGKYITCTKGSTVLTDVVPASKVVEFKVTEFGDWVIACDGLSKTVNTYYYGLYTVDMRAIIGLVPIMTSNTTPYGEAFGKSQQTSGVYDYWKAFNGNADGDSSSWASANNDPNAWIGYHFVNPVCAKRVHLQNRIVTTVDNNCRILTFKVQASNDNITWTDITDVINRGSGASESGYASTHDFENNNYYSYYRILPVTSTTSITGVAILQFYGYED